MNGLDWPWQGLVLGGQQGSQTGWCHVHLPGIFLKMTRRVHAGMKLELTVFLPLAVKIWSGEEMSTSQLTKTSCEIVDPLIWVPGFGKEV